MDTSHKLSPKSYKGFVLVEDYGIRLLTYGNTGGGNFTAPYRSFIIKDKTNNHQFVSIALSSFSRSETLNAREKTAICVAVDDF